MTSPGVLLLSILLGFSVAGSPAEPWTPREGSELVGTPAPEWRGIRWAQGGPLTRSELEGKIILLRFWLVQCPYCTRTAPALREVWEEYRERGVVVVGLHHPKSRAARDPELVARAARELGWTFPIGLDNDWTTIRAYGVGKNFERFTSVSFLIDREGIIRFVHDGGEFHSGGRAQHADCNRAWRTLRTTLDALLSEQE